MSKKEIDRLDDLVTELMCASNSLTMVLYVMDDKSDSEYADVIDSIYATKHYINRIGWEMDTIVTALKKEIAA